MCTEWKEKSPNNDRGCSVSAHLYILLPLFRISGQFFMENKICSTWKFLYVRLFVSNETRNFEYLKKKYFILCETNDEPWWFWWCRRWISFGSAVLFHAYTNSAHSARMWKSWVAYWRISMSPLHVNITRRKIYESNVNRTNSCSSQCS